MTDITGLWQMNASGSVGTMYIASIDGQGNLTGKITFVDAPRADTLMKATWNDATGSIYFERWIGNDPNNLFKQFFTGYLGDNHPDQLLILAGFFTDNSGNEPRDHIGWFAQQTQPRRKPSVSIMATDESSAPPTDLIGRLFTQNVTRTYRIRTSNLDPDNPTITWSGRPQLPNSPDVVFFISPQGQPTATLEFHMQGAGDNNDHTFNITVQVVDKLGVSASDTEQQGIQQSDRPFG